LAFGHGVTSSNRPKVKTLGALVFNVPSPQSSGIAFAGRVAPLIQEALSFMIPLEIFQQIRRIQIRTRRSVESIFAGGYHSVFKGRGMEFAEIREYVPGDDVRDIDWNATARRGQPYVKRQVEERELTVMLLVDLSASGRFGSVTRVKAEIAVEMCAVLALSAITNNDKVGLILFSDKIERFVRPQRGKNRVLRVIRELLTASPSGRGTDVALALQTLHRVSRQPTVSFIISDFLTESYEKSLGLVAQRHDVIPICISDRREYQLPDAGLVTLEDFESGEWITLDTHDASVRERYAAIRRNQDTCRQRLFTSLGLDSIEVRTDEPYDRPLMQFFQRREQRLRDGR